MEVIVVSGLSGAGKSQGIKCLEDLGYYCIDNMPIALVKEFLNLVLQNKEMPQKIGFVVDVRGSKFDINLGDGIRKLLKLGISVKVIFLEASNQVIIRRFSETRRVHPVTGNSPTIKDIENERVLLKDIRELADVVIDTSNMKGSRLKREIHKLLAKKDDEIFVVNITSFGYKFGIPTNSDLVMDMRFIPNPYYVKSLRKLTGNNKKIKDYIFKYKEVEEFIKDFSKLINSIIPMYKREGKHHINLAFGCTGGQHRSVAMANEFASILEKQGKQIVLEHRDIKIK